MTTPDDNNGPADRPPGDAGDPGDEATGLPWPRTWAGVYVLVTGCFVAWVVLLVVLELVFS
jgi:hypothetical protein